MASSLRSRVQAGAAIHLAEQDLQRLDTVERTVEIRCASGDRWTASWGGTPVVALVDDVDPPLETTHLVFESDDGYRACLDVHTALEGVLAETRDGQSLERTDRPRLVCPHVEGMRTVKGVSTIRAVSLSRDEDPERLEALDIEETDNAS